MTDKPSTKRPTGKTARAYHKGNVTNDLLEVAARLLKTERFEDVTVRRLCREVGVTPGNFYNHFPSLEWLLLDLAAEGFDQQTQLTTRRLKAAASREEAVVMSTVALVEFGHANPELFRIMFGQISNEIVRDHERFAEASRAAFAKLVEVVYGEDIFRADDVAWSHEHCGNAYAVFAFGYGLARVISMEQITFPTGTKAERVQFVEAMARTLVHGLDLQPRKTAATRRA
jgi:AcrR family transcriptional regulator